MCVFLVFVVARDCVVSLCLLFVIYCLFYLFFCNIFFLFLCLLHCLCQGFVALCLCVLCEDIMQSHTLYVFGCVVRMSADCGCVVSFCCCCCLFIFCFIFL